MNPEDEKEAAVERTFYALALRKIDEITARLDPPPTQDETIEEVLSRALEAGDEEARRLVSEEGRESLMETAREMVSDMAGAEDSSPEKFIMD